jgi:hypothetical protein
MFVPDLQPCMWGINREGFLILSCHLMTAIEPISDTQKKWEVNKWLEINIVSFCRRKPLDLTILMSLTASLMFGCFLDPTKEIFKWMRTLGNTYVETTYYVSRLIFSLFSCNGMFWAIFITYKLFVCVLQSTVLIYNHIFKSLHLIFRKFDTCYNNFKKLK